MTVLTIANLFFYNQTDMMKKQTHLSPSNVADLLEEGDLPLSYSPSEELSNRDLIHSECVHSPTQDDDVSRGSGRFLSMNSGKSKEEKMPDVRLNKDFESCLRIDRRINSHSTSNFKADFDHLKEEFLSTISHELKTPLSSMYLSIHLLEMLLDEEDGLQNGVSEKIFSQIKSQHDRKSKIRQYLSILSSNCKKEISLINNLLTLQNSVSLIPNPTLSCIALNDWMQEFVKPFHAKFQSKKIRFSCKFLHAPTYISSDPIRLEKILQELMINAYKFTPEGGCVTLSVTQKKRALILTVVNKGENIPPEEVPYLFNAFYRACKADPWKVGGTGIGLALVKKLTEEIGGEIKVRTGLFGNAFTLNLPEVDASQC